MKTIFTILALLAYSFTFSQEFILTEKNLINKDDPSKDYLVLDFTGKTKDQLFTLTKKYLTATYKGIKNDGYNETSNDQIVIDVLSQEYRKMWINMSGSNLWKATNRYEINFKDEKLMVRPTFSHFSNTMNDSTASIGVLFDSSGKVKKEKGVMFVEDLANTFIRNLKKGIEENKSNDW